MKKKLIGLLSVLAILTIIGIIIIYSSNGTSDSGNENNSNQIKVVTTFYPVYMIGLNLTNQTEGIEVNSLTELNTGCLHDYQLTTQDMKLISKADVLIINGGGMEGFLEDVTANYPQLTIIDATEGISMLPNEAETQNTRETDSILQEQAGQNTSEDDNTSNNSDNPQEKFNAHVWLDPKLYVQQIENVKNGLLDYLSVSESSNATPLTESIETNAQTYIQKVLELDHEIEQIKKSILDFNKDNPNGQQAVIFHDSFAYLANRVGISVAFTVPLDSDTSLSAGDIAEIIDEVKRDNIRYLFTEEQYSASIAKQIEAETAAKVYIIDSAVTGDHSEDSYLNAMNQNLEVIKQALK